MNVRDRLHNIAYIAWFYVYLIQKIDSKIKS